jgi:hypothetical protein
MVDRGGDLEILGGSLLHPLEESIHHATFQMSFPHLKAEPPKNSRDRISTILFWVEFPEHHSKKLPDKNPST